MKKLLVVLVLIGVTAGAFAQDVFASYNKPGDLNVYASVGWLYNIEASAAAEWVVGEFELGPLPFDWGIQVRGAFDIGYYFYFGAGALASLHFGLATVPVEFYAAIGLCYNSWSTYFVDVASYNGITWWFSKNMGLLVEGGYLGWGFWGVGLELKI